LGRKEKRHQRGFAMGSLFIFPQSLGGPQFRELYKPYNNIYSAGSVLEQSYKENCGD
jgi:hypothetical protein